MSKLKTIFLTVISITLLSSQAAYAEKNKDKALKAVEDQEEKNAPKLKDSVEFQKVIDEYKAYVATVPVEIREEVIAYRMEVAKLNKEKRMLYKKLTQASQDYLKKEQQYKKRLPLQRKNLINLTVPQDSDSENKSESELAPIE